jgi:hypothetical protein
MHSWFTTPSVAAQFHTSNEYVDENCLARMDHHVPSPDTREAGQLKVGETMPIPNGHKTNFKTMLVAGVNDDLSLMWCWDKKDERFVAVVCGVNKRDDGTGDVDFVPFAMMLGEEDPYERFLSPGHPDYPEDKDVEETKIPADDDAGGDEPAAAPETNGPSENLD